jgi:hypothetical protein
VDRRPPGGGEGTDSEGRAEEGDPHRSAPSRLWADRPGQAGRRQVARQACRAAAAAAGGDRRTSGRAAAAAGDSPAARGRDSRASESRKKEVKLKTHLLVNGKIVRFKRRGWGGGGG